MSTTVESQSTAQRPSSWRDEVLAEYEISQARLRCIIADDEPEEFL